MNHQQVVFIGAGNMARAIIMGLIQSDYPVECLSVSNRSPEQLEQFAQLGMQTSTDNKILLSNADVVLLAVKPHQVKTVCQEIASGLPQHAMVVSIAAGVETRAVQQWLGKPVPVVRAMPNTPAMVNAGATGLYATPEVDASRRNFIESIFRSVGVVAWVDEESQIPMVTALSGSAPAYFFKIMEAMEQKALEFGLPHDMAKLFITQTALGAAKLAAESAEDFAQLRQSVTSPNGTTERGLDVLQKADINQIVADVMDAVLDRAKEIAKELSC